MLLSAFVPPFLNCSLYVTVLSSLTLSHNDLLIVLAVLSVAATTTVDTVVITTTGEVNATADVTAEYTTEAVTGDNEMTTAGGWSIDASTADPEACSTWTVIYQQMIVGHNDFTMTGITLEQCKDACLNHSSCQSIEYRNSSSLCYLQYIRRDALSTQADFIAELSTDYYEWTNCCKFFEDDAH